MFEVLSHIWARLGRRVIVERLRHSPPLPPVSSTPVGAARSRPGRQVGDPYQAQKLLACSNQRDTAFSPFTLTYYLRPRRWAMPGGLGHLHRHRVGSVSVRRHSHFPPPVSSMYRIGRGRALTYSYKPRCVFVRRHSRQKKPRRLARLFSLCWHYLSSRQVTLQVLSAQMSLTSVFGMGTGGPSSQSTPTIFHSRVLPETSSIILRFSRLSSAFFLGDPSGIRTHVNGVRGRCLNHLTMGPWCTFTDSNRGPTD